MLATIMIIMLLVFYTSYIIYRQVKNKGNSCCNEGCSHCHLNNK